MQPQYHGLYSILTDPSARRIGLQHRKLQFITAVNTGLKVDCCLVVSFFGVIFYISMGFLILGQPQFLRFVWHDNAKSIGACFISSFIFLLFLVGMIVLKRREESTVVERINYSRFEGERERGDSTAGVQMGQLRYQRQQQ